MSHDWVSLETLAALALGTFLLLWVAVRTLKVDPNGCYSLHVAFLLTVWIGYFVTPLLDLVWGNWETWLLSPAYIPNAVINAFLAMCLFSTGYALAHPSRRWLLAYRRSPHAHPRENRARQGVSTRTIVILSLVVLFLTILTVGGVDQLMFPDYSRSEGQWDYSLRGQFLRILKTASSITSVILAASLGANVGQAGRVSPKIPLVVWGLTVASLIHVHDFGRLAGAPLIAFAVTYGVVAARKNYMLIAVLLALAGYMSLIGFTQRSVYSTGVANFIHAMTDPFAIEETSVEPFNPGLDHPLNSVDAWTRRASMREIREGSSLPDDLVTLLSAIQPLPSSVARVNVSIGPSISQHLGTAGRIGLTSPALAETYYLFGYWGGLIMVFLGAVCSRADRLMYTHSSARVLLFRMTIALGFVIGLHGGIRAMTRPLIYGFILFIVVPRLIETLQGRVGPSPVRNRTREI